MCLAFFGIEASKKYPLIIAFNRDEDYDRPTASLDYWDDQSNILGGRDLLKGGTWAGVTKEGRYGFLTFYREPRLPAKKWKPRGHLVRDFLKSKFSPREFLEIVFENREDYLGFNLVVGEGQCFYHYSNRDSLITQLGPGVHGVSNAVLNTPWPKVTKGVDAIKKSVETESCSVNSLVEIMLDSTRFSDDLLPSTGVSLERERELSSLFVTTPNYGTLSTSVLLLDAMGQLTFYEQNHYGDKVITEKHIHIG